MTRINIEMKNEKNNSKLTVADFFCGAGGWSEGFRLAGFEVEFALDNWNVARKTHSLNHPECKRHPGLDCFEETNGNILEINSHNIEKILPDTDIIVGSPPCVSFSQSNKAGKADKTLGVQLITRFLKIVAIKKHKKNSKLKYWLMENVPNSRHFIKEEYSFEDLEFTEDELKQFNINKTLEEVALKMPTSKEYIFNAANFGVAQRRERFITGNFPKPKESHIKEDWVNLGAVLGELDISKEKVKVINDPNFEELKIPNSELTDHFYKTSIHKFDWYQAKLAKEQARYYGRMSFPEEPSKPSRTIMATRSTRVREAMIFPDEKGNYRAPTIREVACIMSFPISYQFQGKDELSKYRLVGNAVCPKLSFAFANEISKELNVELNKFKFKNKFEDLEVDLRKNPPKIKLPQGKTENAGFAYIVPDLKFNNVRIELDNNFPNKGNDISWRVSIHHATGKTSMKSAFPSLKQIKELIRKIENQDKVEKFEKDLEKIFTSKIPSAQKFQKQYIMVNPDKNYFTPFETLEKLSKLTLKHFPMKEFKESYVSNLKKDDIEIISFDKGKIPGNKISIIQIIALYGLKKILLI